MPVDRFIPVEIATKLALALGIGLLVGFEREWSHKDMGVRTFAIVCLFGMLCSLESQTFAWIGMVAVIAIAATMNVSNIVLHRQIETTTSVALAVTFTLGALVGQGYVFAPTATAVVMTLLLALKPELSRFAGGLTAEELRGAVLLGLIGFVIYPLLPDYAIDPWGLLNPRQSWITVILIAALGFVNYVLLKAFSTRGLYYSALFGGLVNSAATIVDLSRILGGQGAAAEEMLVGVSLITMVAMFFRNLVIVTAFSRPAGAIAVWPIAAMTVVTAAVLWRQRHANGDTPAPKVPSPIALGRIAIFGFYFIVIQALTILGQRYFGESGTDVASLLGGLLSSSSATAAAGTLASQNQISPAAAASSTVLASISSQILDIPILYRSIGKGKSFKRLAILQAASTAIGLIVLFAILRFNRS